MKNKVEVEIRGDFCSGKSTIALEIMRALCNKGISVTVNDDDINRLESLVKLDKWVSNQNKRLASLADKTEVSISTKQVRQHSGCQHSSK